MSRRLAKVAEAIRESISTSILFKLRDPRVKNVTVIRAEVSGDIQHAKVYISVRGDEKTQALSLQGLNAARGFLQKNLAERLQTRYTPLLTFELDRGVQLAAQASAILNAVLPDSNLAALTADSSATDNSMTDDEANASPEEAEQANEPSATSEHESGEPVVSSTGIINSPMTETS